MRCAIIHANLSGADPVTREISFSRRDTLSEICLLLILWRDLELLSNKGLPRDVSVDFALESFSTTKKVSC
jgi:hypothetical protein